MLEKHDFFKTHPDFYSGYPLLAKTDKHGKKPEIYIAASNRSAGKTTFFNGMTLHNFIKKKKRFLLLYRHKYEISQAADGFFKDINKLFFPGLSMIQSTGVKNVFDTLLIGENTQEKETSYIPCGYATSLSAAEQIKKYSHLLSDIDVILLDEAFPEDGRYLPNEIDLFMSIHDSLARGNGQMSKYLPVIIIGNLIDIFNPYFDALGVIDSLQLESNFTRGDGFVIEQNFNEVSAKAHADSAFHRALAGASYGSATQERKYLNTSYDMIDAKVCDSGRYMLTIAYKEKLYSVRYNEQGFFYYVSNTPDKHFKLQHAATEKDISDDAIYNPMSPYRKLLKEQYHKNQIKFKNLKCKDAALHFIAGK